MASYHYMYPGGEYGMKSEIDPIYGPGGPPPASSFGLATDPFTAAQVQKTIDKLNTGAKVVEVGAIQASVFEAIPKQHFDEIRRLKELAGAELTFHGPIVEPSGWGRGGYSDQNRIKAEQQIKDALFKAHQMQSEGEPGIISTFHSATDLPELKTRIPHKEGELITEFVIISDQGETNTIKPVEQGLISKKGKIGITEKEMGQLIDKQSEEFWTEKLTSAIYHANQGKSLLKDTENVLKYYKSPEGQKLYETLGPAEKQVYLEKINNINHGEINIKDSYHTMHNLFNRASKIAAEKGGNKEDLEKLEKYSKNFEKIRAQGVLDNPKKLDQFADEILKGMNLLNTIKTPKIWRPMNDFMIDKSSETFGNAAFAAYEEFGDNAPIISIENPPAGGALTRASDLRQLIKSSRKKFVKNAMASGISKSQAEGSAEKLIGATWDVGHINLIRGAGFEEKHIIEESRRIKPYLKHIHLSDNFGFEHTELPMGMANVPMKEHLEALGEKAKKAKQIIETGDWYKYFRTTPFRETLEAFGSPIYSMKMSPVWKPGGITAEYASGMGPINPPIHHQTYGSGFTNLPSELGGAMQGGGTSRFSGTPT